MKLWFVLPALVLLAVAFVVFPVWADRRRRMSSRHPSSSLDGNGQATGLWISLGITGFVACVAFASYALVGRPDLLASDVASAAPEAQKQDMSPASSMASMIEQLKTKVQQSPKDADAWQTLGWAYMHIRQPVDAVEAYKHAVALSPNDTSYRSALAEATIQSGEGKITEQTLSALRAIAAKNPTDPRTRFYLALHKDQQGDHKGAIADWIALVKSAPLGAGWAPEVRQVILKVAQEEHIDISGQLPPLPPDEGAAPIEPMPGPNAEQMAAAQQIPEAERNAMIHGMVDRLAGDLRQNPHNADGWQRLIRARTVLGEKDQAVAAYRDARHAFSADPAQLAAIGATAKSLGITGQ